MIRVVGILTETDKIVDYLKMVYYSTKTGWFMYQTIL